MLETRRLVWDLVFFLIGFEVLVVLLDLWLYCGGVIASEDLRALFDATSERGLSSWLAVTQASLIALTLWLMTAVYRQLPGSRARLIGWAVLAAFFTYLAFDDGTQLHERLGSAFDESAASETGLGGAFPSYYWQLLLGPFFGAMGLFMAVFLWREFQSRQLRLLVLGALALLAGAVALDFIEGLHPNHPLNALARLAETEVLYKQAPVLFGMSAFEAVTHLARSIEESIEMMAMTMLWAAFLLHFASLVHEVRLRWTDPNALAHLARQPRRSVLRLGVLSGQMRSTAKRSQSETERPVHV